MYSVPEHTFTFEHWRLIDAVGARVWHVVPSVHAVHALQLVMRCPVADWYVLAGHALHVRCDATVSADMRSPAPHVGCAMHAVSRWLLDVWYMSEGHALHVRIAVVVSDDMS